MLHHNKVVGITEDEQLCGGQGRYKHGEWPYFLNTSLIMITPGPGDLTKVQEPDISYFYKWSPWPNYLPLD
jgi:hypothetical protein